MGRYPRRARNARIKCIPCNAPVTTTADGKYVCVECGRSPIEKRSEERETAEVLAAND